jgi:hypothetical protein
MIPKFNVCKVFDEMPSPLYSFIKLQVIAPLATYGAIKGRTLIIQRSYVDACNIFTRVPIFFGHSQYGFYDDAKSQRVDIVNQVNLGFLIDETVLGELELHIGEQFGEMKLILSILGTTGFATHIVFTIYVMTVQPHISGFL